MKTILLKIFLVGNCQKMNMNYQLKYQSNVCSLLYLLSYFAVCVASRCREKNRNKPKLFVYISCQVFLIKCSFAVVLNTELVPVTSAFKMS